MAEQLPKKCGLLGVPAANHALDQIDGTFTAMKDQGNRFYKAGDFDAACHCWTRAYGHSEATLADKALAAGNITQAKLVRYHAKHALEWADKALVHDANHVKNLYRKARALDLMGKYEDADKYYERALELAKSTNSPQTFQDEVNDKLQDMRARVTEKAMKTHNKKVEKMKMHEQMVAAARPKEPDVDLTQEEKEKAAGAAGYHENDWRRWLCKQLYERCIGDPLPEPDSKRLNCFTDSDIAVLYVPDRFPMWGVLPGSPEHRCRSKVQMIPTPGGEDAAPALPPCLPPIGREVESFMKMETVTGDCGQWRRGSLRGLRYEFNVQLWWRAVRPEICIDDKHMTLEGTVKIECNDENAPEEWQLTIMPDPLSRNYGPAPPIPKEEQLEEVMALVTKLCTRLKVEVIPVLLKEIEKRPWMV